MSSPYGGRANLVASVLAFFNKDLVSNSIGLQNVTLCLEQ